MEENQDQLQHQNSTTENNDMESKEALQDSSNDQENKQETSSTTQEETTQAIDTIAKQSKNKREKIEECILNNKEIELKDLLLTNSQI